MNKIYLTARNLMAAMVLAAAPLMLAGCGSTGDEPVTQAPIIPNLQLITLTQPANSLTPALAVTSSLNFVYSADGDVKHMILFVCTGTGCATGMISNGKVTINTSVAGGNSTSKTMTLTSTPMTEVYQISNWAFTNNRITPGSGTYEWFIIGYDSGGNLIAASPAFSFTTTSW